VGTYRPAELPSDAALVGLAHELVIHRRAHEMRLERLPAAAVGEYLGFRLARTPVSRGLVEHVHRRTDGNPLFMVTVTDDLLARALVVERGGGWEVEHAGRGGADDVPDALRRLIEQQARRLAADDRCLLEAASVAGFEFSAAAVAAGLDRDQSEVEARCAELARLGRFLSPSAALADGYAFVHALHRDVLYAGIPAGWRRRLHGRIADRLEHGFPGRAREAAAALAMHWERAHDAHRAAHYYRLAAEMALRRAANAEAITHVRRGLEALHDVAAGRQRMRTELALYLTGGPAWIVSRGYATEEVERAYSRALALARRLHAVRDVPRALRGLWNVSLMRADLRTARRLATELLAHAKRSRDRGARAEAHAALGETLFHGGAPRPGLVHLVRSGALIRRGAGPRDTSQQPRVAVYAGWALWTVGYPDQARRLCDQAVAAARSLGRPHNRAFALGYAGIVYQLCGDVARVAELADEQGTICREHDIPYWRSVADILASWVLAMRGRVADGARGMRAGIEAYRQTGSVLGVSHLLTLLAEVHADAGDMTAAREAAHAAHTLVQQTDDRCVLPDIERVCGKILLRGPRGARVQGERCLAAAIDVSRRRGARGPELRAATEIARVWLGRKEHARAHRLLSPLCRWFTEGADTRDVRAARALLADVEAGDRRRVPLGSDAPAPGREEGSQGRHPAR